MSHESSASTRSDPGILARVSAGGRSAAGRLPAPLIFVASSLSQYLGAGLAVSLFSLMPSMTVAWGRLVVGAAVAALMKAAVPAGFLAFLTENLWFGIVVMALLAVLLSLCSEADAFVAASLPGVSPTAQLVFLVVGPMVDVKLFAMQSGAFGAKFATRFMPLTLFVCIWSAAVVGAVMFGTF